MKFVIIAAIMAWLVLLIGAAYRLCPRHRARKIAIPLFLLLFGTACTAMDEESPGQVLDLESLEAALLPVDAVSNVQDGSARYGAVLELGDLDGSGRPTYAHIRLSDGQEPKNHGKEREPSIHVDPAGWENRKWRGYWLNHRCHLIGWQFSGLGDELRNLAIGTAYVNTGSYRGDMDADNPDGMLFYEMRLDQWLKEHPDCQLDYYVRPVYIGERSYEPEGFYLQWVGIGPDGLQTAIETGGYAEPLSGALRAVWLPNVKEPIIRNEGVGKEK